MKKKTFFRELLDPDSGVSSKRFSGLILLFMFAIAANMSIFLDLDVEAKELVVTEGIIGAALLGVNVFESVVKAKKKKEENNEQEGD